MKLKPSILKWSFFVAAAAAYLGLKKFGLHYTATGDENAYFYMARLMAEGKLFYRDFFFAHPPLQLLLLALLYSLFGFNFVLFKLTAALPVLVGAGFIYHQFWRKGENLAGAFFLLLFLFNYELLKISTHPFGLNLTALFLMFSLYFLLEERPWPCGLLWGCASLTGLYALPWGVAPLVYFALFKKRGLASAAAFLGGFILIFGLTNAVFALLFKDKYLVPVFFYHFLKPKGTELIADVFIRVARRNIPLFFLPFLYIWSPKTRQGNTVLAAGALYLVFLARLNPLFTQYFMLPLPYLAWIGAVGLAGWLKRVPPLRLRPVAAVVAAIVLAAFVADNIRRYLIHEEGTGFQNVDFCARFILRNSSNGDLLFGHVTTVPLLALLTGRDIALDEVDTNHMRFKAGLPPVEEIIRKLEGEPRLKYFIIQESRFWLDPRIRSFLKRCEPVAVFEEPRERIVIYDCRKGKTREEIEQ